MRARPPSMRMVEETPLDNDGVPETHIRGTGQFENHAIAVAVEFKNEPGMREANARRLFACWNALNGMHADTLGHNWTLPARNKSISARSPTAAPERLIKATTIPEKETIVLNVASLINHRYETICCHRVEKPSSEIIPDIPLLAHLLSDKLFYRNNCLTAKCEACSNVVLYGNKCSQFRWSPQRQKFKFHKYFVIVIKYFSSQPRIQLTFNPAQPSFYRLNTPHKSSDGYQRQITLRALAKALLTGRKPDCTGQSCNSANCTNPCPPIGRCKARPRNPVVDGDPRHSQ